MRLSFLLSTVAVGLSAWLTGVQANSQSRDALNYLTLVEEPRIHTHNQRLHAYSSFDLTFDLHKHAQHVRLRLEPNYDILHEDAHVQYLDKNGGIRHSEKIDRLAHKVFHGDAFTVQEDGTNLYVGWARIVVQRDGSKPIFEGAFAIMGDEHHIQMKSKYMSTKHPHDPSLAEPEDGDEYMAVFRDSDIGRSSHTDLRRRNLDQRACTADRLPFNNDPAHPVFNQVLKRGDGSWGSVSAAQLLGKRQSNIDGGGAGNGNSAGVNLRNTIGDTSGCPSSKQVALIGVATDCGYTSSFNSTQSMKDNVVLVVNTASTLYQSTFNVTLGLRNLTVSDAECPGTPATQTAWNVGCSSNTNLEQRLNLFSQWRGTQGDSNAYWSLFTTCNTGAEVGLAWLGQLCNHQGTDQQDTSGNTQTVTGANVIAKTSTEWQVFAHETGHTFGAVHDCDSSACANANYVSSSQCCPVSSTGCDAQAQYMMNPYSAPGISRFSPCSIGNICSGLGRNSVQSTCLSDNRGVVTITGSVCGNGIVEEDEDCDCGGSQGCAGNGCCDPNTCKYTANSVCDPSNEGCCTDQCQFASSGVVCRAATGVCDPQETCTGTNGTCPYDRTADDGTGCGNGLECASGQCTSRDQQCKTAMGSYTEGNQTYACNSQTCVLSCASPDFGSNVCYSMAQNFLDGTPCGGGGHCNNGVCRGGSVGGQVKSWIDDNRTLVIALASAIGGLILLAILGCCVRACRRPRGKRVPAPVRRGQGPAQHGAPGWTGPVVPPAMAQRGYGHPSNQQYQPWQPPAPPPAYGHGHGHGHFNQHQPGNPSVRYA